MRVLDTHSGQFVWLTDPQWTSYAVLSHVWSVGGEQSYQELVEIQKDVQEKTRALASTEKRGLWFGVISRLWSSATRTDASTAFTASPTTMSILSDPRVSSKISNACAAARERGYRYLWIDSCCIDKSSSAELSEAINCMYQWYKFSGICLVHLADVDSQDDPRSKDSQFSLSRWHRRGWTLQELIAPVHVLFFSRDWRAIGSKASLGDIIEWVTGIERDVLHHSKPLECVSVSRRMWWASDRYTTRVEDEAYSLMGIFGVHMTPIYGEGTQAFIRLQQEILRIIPDQTIFAWGPNLSPPRDKRRKLDPSSFVGPSDPQYPRYLEFHRSNTFDPRPLFASTPLQFFASGGLRALSQEELVRRRILSTPQITPFEPVVTSSGVRVRFPLLKDVSITRTTKSGSTRPCGRPDYLAILACVDKHGNLVTLPLSTPIKDSGLFYVAPAARVIYPARWWPMSNTFLDGIHLEDIVISEILILHRPLRMDVSYVPARGVSTAVIDRGASLSSYQRYKVEMKNQHYPRPRLETGKIDPLIRVSSPHEVIHIILKPQVPSWRRDDADYLHADAYRISATHAYRSSIDIDVDEHDSTIMKASELLDPPLTVTYPRLSEPDRPMHIQIDLPPTFQSQPQRPGRLCLIITQRMILDGAGSQGVAVTKS